MMKLLTHYFNLLALFIVVIICCSSSFSSKLMAQAYSDTTNQRNIAVVCMYNYNDALETGLSSIDTVLHYLVAKCNRQGKYDIEEVPHFDTMMQKVKTDRNLLCFVHGFNSNIDEIIENSALFTAAYDVDLLVFAWPSYETKGKYIRNYKQSRENVIYCIPNFSKTMSQVAKYLRTNEDVRGTLMFNSLGNLFAKKYAQYLINNVYDKNDFPQFENVILNAPCIFERDHDIWSDMLNRMTAKHFYVTQNGNDGVLKAASIFIEGGPLLGQADIVTHSEKLKYIDFTEILKNSPYKKAHGYYEERNLLEIPNTFTFYYLILNGYTPYFNDTTFCIKRTDVPYDAYKLVQPKPLTPCFTARDRFLYDSIYHLLKKPKRQSINELMTTIAEAQIGTPFVKTCIDQNSKGFVINLHETNHLRFVENSLAMMLTAKYDHGNFKDFCSLVQQLRYNKKTFSNFLYRHLYSSSWIRSAEIVRFIDEITFELGGEMYKQDFSYITTHADHIPQLIKHPEYLEYISSIENQLSRDSYFFIPKEKFDEACIEKIESGDLLFFTTTIKGLDIEIQGVAYQKDDQQMGLIHASLEAKKVVLEEESLLEFVKNSETISGVRVVKLLEQNKH
ncbi:MAG: DUF1460 domain-containing protein [Bacteroidales bacterium]|nr:DUF1460 domain-containing protein [Bacteroidales bacterium]